MTLNSLCLFFSSLSLSLPPFFRGLFVTSVMCRCTFMRFAVPCVVINSLLSPLVGVRVFMIEVKHISFVYENFTFTIQCINFTFATYVVGERTYGVFFCVRINFIIIHFLLFGILNFERTLVQSVVWLKTETQNDFSFKLLINLTHLKFFYFDTITSAIK